jgi:drug/metabolite transporter (DMT)-like permease
MKLKIVAGFSFLLNTILFATYYSVSKEALGRIDPIIFSFFEMMTLAPVALCIIFLSWKDISRAVVKRGILLGSCLCLAFFTIAIALKYTSATSTAFFPSLNGFLAALIAWFFLQQPVRKLTWFAGILSVIGTVLLVVNSPMGGWRGSLIAFLGGLFFTCYVFLANQEQKDETPHWPLFGIELLTMAVWANLVALLFGDWQSIHPALPKDAWVILYVAGACTFLPTLITVLMQRHISPVTVSFIYILEPILGAVAANIYLNERLPLQGYTGGALIVAGAIIHTWGTAEHSSNQHSIQSLLSLGVRRLHGSWVGTLGYPIVCFSAGFFLLYGLGAVPPHSWRDLYYLWPLLPQYIQQGHGGFVLLLAIQAASWLIAGASLIVLGLLAIYNSVRKIFLEPDIPTWDVRPHRQTGTVPYSIARKGEKTLVQRRRRDRLLRLGLMELIE